MVPSAAAAAPQQLSQQDWYTLMLQLGGGQAGNMGP